ncbi:AEC family transporter [Lichenihabitans sp. PAMC28606]|uniref:AEC family transporter n=1 Tax=Lichenihabitans sp. PAMC28606 TaxID=2880932 RepID=UPI001D09B214|nr:AEC family transporter [Lichenihabitans sp. PAMC28606]UDL95880.1 AEC family transporter [Lichenihabitans sp. PAMC28606]
MLTTVLVLVPIFALILVGYLCRRSGILGPHSTTELNRFVVYLALPALLFDIMAHTSVAAFYQPGFIEVFGLSCAIVFAITIAIRLRKPRHLADASIDGLNAAYGNTGFIGFPLTLIVFGKASLAPTTAAAIITVCILFGVAIVLIEIGLQAERRVLHLASKVGRSLVKNPLLLSPVLGGLVAATGLSLPDSVEVFLKLLGGAASPCALVALGLFLAQNTETAQNDTPATLFLVGLKLILQPAVAWVLATLVFGLSPALTKMAVVLAAMPTGTGPFMLAEFYGREAGITSKAILISTVVSLFTISAYLTWAA